MADEEKLDPPKETLGDHAHSVVRAGLGAIPFAGSAAVELFNKVVMPPLERRRDRWREMVGARLRKLEARGAIDPETLQQDDAFITVMMQASQAAMRNHHEEKLQALQNAVLNAALPNPPDESIQQMFVQLVDTFTEWHIRLLKLFQDPRAWFHANNRTPPSFAITSNLGQLLTSAYPELKNRGDLYELIFNELESKGLCSGGDLHVMMSPSGAFAKLTTDLGDRFIGFITEPEAAREDV